MEISTWIKNNCLFLDPFCSAKREVIKQVSEVKEIFSSLKKIIKTAKSRNKDLHFFISPKLAEKYNINLHYLDDSVQQDDEDLESYSSEDSDSNEGNVYASKKDGQIDFKEETVTFASKRKYEPNYTCSVIFQKPESEIFVVSAYMIETYLGRYAFKANYYFKKENKKSALRCYQRVVKAVKDLKYDFIEKGTNQNEVPHYLKRALQGENGEVEPKSNDMATFLDPKNVVKQTTIGSENILTIPTSRNIMDDLKIEKNAYSGDDK